MTTMPPLRRAMRAHAATLCKVCACVIALLQPVSAQHRLHADASQVTDADFVRMLEELRHPGTGPSIQSVPVSKCGFQLTTEYLRRRPGMEQSLMIRADAAMRPPQLQAFILSPSGRFRINYDLTGRNEPAMLSGGQRVPGSAMQYVQAVASFYDESYDVEVAQHGYSAPPFDGTRTVYDIYIVDFPRGFYGHTKTIAEVPAGHARTCYTTFIEMDNDYINYASAGLDGAKVTAAHEFHHMIQLGAYGSWNDDLFFYEMTSTHFEDVVFNDVNDYLYYLPEYFNLPERTMFSWPGYQMVHFVRMLDARHTRSAVRRIWEEIRRQDPLSAMETVLRSPAYQTDLSSEFCRFARWNWYTADRVGLASPADRDAESASFPRMRAQSSVQMIGSSVTLEGRVAPLAVNYVQAWRGSDTVTFCVSNTDLYSAVRKQLRYASFRLEVRESGYGSEFTRLTNGWGYRFLPEDLNVLCLGAFSGTLITDRSSSPFPNPYDPARDGLLRIPVRASVPQTRASLAIHTVSMDLVASFDNIAIRGDEEFGRYVSWDGRVADGSDAASGVYVYTMVIGDEVVTGKFAVVRR